MLVLKPPGSVPDAGPIIVHSGSCSHLMKTDRITNSINAINAQSHQNRLSACVLASGSKGNSIFVSDGECSLLVDAGLSGVEIERRLLACGLSPERLDAILISHEHTDHIQSAGVLARRYKLPVYISKNTLRAAYTQLGKLNDLRYFESGVTFFLNHLQIHPFSISHDAADPAGFTFMRDGRKIGLATDLGTVTAVVRDHLRESDLLILEANHDPAMLIGGRYPWPVKQRIKGRTGHLSNPDSRNLLASVCHPGLKQVVLAHLSQENNTPEKAVSMVGEALHDHRAGIAVARQDQCGRLFSV